ESQLGAARLAAAEVVQEGAARGVGKRANGGVQHTLNHPVEYSARRPAVPVKPNGPIHPERLRVILSEEPVGCACRLASRRAGDEGSASRCMRRSSGSFASSG